MYNYSTRSYHKNIGSNFRKSTIFSRLFSNLGSMFSSVFSVLAVMVPAFLLLLLKLSIIIFTSAGVVQFFWNHNIAVEFTFLPMLKFYFVVSVMAIIFIISWVVKVKL